MTWKAGKSRDHEVQGKLRYAPFFLVGVEFSFLACLQFKLGTPHPHLKFKTWYQTFGSLCSLCQQLTGNRRLGEWGSELETASRKYAAAMAVASAKYPLTAHQNIRIRKA